MSEPAVFHFLVRLGQDGDRLAALRHAPKDAVLAEAKARGYTFDEAGFDATLWQTEADLAARIGEPFDFAGSMWETMWGKTYLDYLVHTVAPAALAAFHPVDPDSTKEKS